MSEEQNIFQRKGVMEMEYTINIAKPVEKQTYYMNELTTYKELEHYCKIIVPYGRVREVYGKIKTAFPDYQIDVYAWETKGKTINVENIDY